VNEPAGKLENYPVEVNFRVPGDERTHPLIESQWRATLPCPENHRKSGQVAMK
jgi:hypothetical protein